MRHDRAVTDDQRARYAAAHERAFREMARTSWRWRMWLMVPFYVAVVAMLAWLGVAPQRVAIQAAVLAALVVALLAGRHSRPDARATWFVTMTAFCHLASIVNTGGLASPLVVTVVPWVIGLALTPPDTKHRGPMLAGFLVMLFALAFATHATLPELHRPVVAGMSGEITGFALLVTLSVVHVSVGVFGIARSVACVYERIALELAARRAEVFNESADRTRALEGIAARLAHEVKNPLSAIRGLSSHMAKSATDAKVAERMAIVASEAERLQEIVDGFLSFSRGLEDLKVEPVSPFEVARELALLLETPAGEAGVRLDVQGSPEVVVNADAKKLRQVLINLVLNAVQASSPGSAVLVEVAQSTSGAATIRVIDRGPGMSKEVLERIRKPYFTTKSGGSGLGVAIARALVEQHGGTLEFESAEGVGTTASVVLPRCALGAAEAQRLPKPECVFLGRKTTCT